MICVNERRSNSLQGYKIIGISVGADVTKKKQEMSIDLIANLWNEKLKGDYFTIGAESLQRADIQPKSPFLTYSNKFTGN